MGKNKLLIVMSAAAMGPTPGQLDPEKIPEALDILDDFMMAGSNDSNGIMVIEARPESTPDIDVEIIQGLKYREDRPHYRQIEYKGRPPIPRR